MNKSRQTLVKTLALILCLISMGLGYGQKETKTFKETFSVSKDAVLNIDTSHTDIEFETWGKDEVSIEATIELEGASEEENKRYFEKESFEILGNSKNVEIKTKGGNSWAFSNSNSALQDLHFEMPEMPEMPEMHEMEVLELPFEMMVLSEIAEMPEMPRTPVPHFDYQAFTKDGEEYMKKWQKEFDKNFDKDYQKKMEEWGKKMEKKQLERVKRQEKLSKRIEERLEERKEQMEERSEQMEEREEELSKRMEEAQKRRVMHVEQRGNRNRSVIISRGGSDEPNVFYFNSEGKNKNYKVKKTIKIKMPKGMKIKMNVRHGEVKLADNIWHMDANLSHSSLWAASIDGDKTTIKASYTPVSIDRWYLGNLQANYAESVNLKEVFDIKLNTTSSNVKIDKLIKKAFIKNEFGQLKIGSITKDFTDLDITLQNAELDFAGPDVAFDIYVNGTSTLVKSPAKIILESTQNHKNIISKGYHINKKSERTIVINAKYSEVKIQ